MRTTDEDILERQLRSISVSAPRPIPLRFQEAANSEIAKYIASGIIAPCDSPTEWCSPAFFVPKGDGKRVRLVTDYTKLNKFVVRPVHPFPSVGGHYPEHTSLCGVFC